MTVVSCLSQVTLVRPGDFAVLRSRTNEHGMMAWFLSQGLMGKEESWVLMATTSENHKWNERGLTHLVDSFPGIKHSASEIQPSARRSPSVVRQHNHWLLLKTFETINRVLYPLDFRKKKKEKQNTCGCDLWWAPSTKSTAGRAD